MSITYGNVLVVPNRQEAELDAHLLEQGLVETVIISEECVA